MNKTFDKVSYSERLQELHNQYELAQESTRDAEQKLNKAKDNEDKALANMTDFIKKSFVQQLKEFFDGAPVAIQVFNHAKDHVLPPEDEPDRYGVRILPTVLQEDDVYVKGEYASVNPIEMDFIDIYHGQHPWFERYDDYYPSFTNIIFLPKDSHWIKSRYIPVKDFSVIKTLMERNNKLYMERLDEEISKLKAICPNYKAYSTSWKHHKYIFLVGKDVMQIQYTKDSFPTVRKGNEDDPLWYRMLDKSYERKEISTDNVCKILDGIVSGNRRYYANTVAKAKKWFDDCVKLAEEHNQRRVSMTLNETVRRFMMAKQELSECNGIFNSMVKDLFSNCSCTWAFKNIDFNDDGTCTLEVVWCHRGVDDEYTLDSVPSDILQEYFTGSKENSVKRFQEWCKETGALDD